MITCPVVAVGTINTTQTLGTLTVNSAAGSKSGDTKVTITPAKASAGNVYKYKVASSETAVDYGQNVKNWRAWDGESDITAMASIYSAKRVSPMIANASDTAVW